MNESMKPTPRPLVPPTAPDLPPDLMEISDIADFCSLRLTGICRRIAQRKVRAFVSLNELMPPVVPRRKK